MRRWIEGILILLAVIFLGAICFLYFYYEIYKKMDSNTIKSAEAALSSGITIDDPKDDFVIMGSNKEEVNNENNPSPYRLSYLDIKSLSLGKDEKYFYYKVTFFDNFPNTPTSIDDDKIKSVGCKAEIMNENGIIQSILNTDFSYIAGIPAPGTYYFYEPTGIEWPEEKRFAHRDSNSKVIRGKDYLLGAFPIEKLNLQDGQRIKIIFSMESRSKKYTHAAVDVLRGKGKQSAIISWTLGTNTFEVADKAEN